MNLRNHAETELEIYNKYVPDNLVKEFNEEILNLISKVAASGHPGIRAIGWKHCIYNLCYNRCNH